MLSLISDGRLNGPPRTVRNGWVNWYGWLLSFWTVITKREPRSQRSPSRQRPLCCAGKSRLRGKCTTLGKACAGGDLWVGGHRQRLETEYIFADMMLIVWLSYTYRHRFGDNSQVDRLTTNQIQMRYIQIMITMRSSIASIAKYIDGLSTVCVFDLLFVCVYFRVCHRLEIAQIQTEHTTSVKYINTASMAINDERSKFKYISPLVVVCFGCPSDTASRFLFFTAVSRRVFTLLTLSTRWYCALC